MKVFVFILDFEIFFEMYESFLGNEEFYNCNFKIIWVVVRNKLEIIELIIFGDVYDFFILKLLCGIIVCDNFEIIRSYMKNICL